MQYSIFNDQVFFLMLQFYIVLKVCNPKILYIMFFILGFFSVFQKQNQDRTAHCTQLCIGAKVSTQSKRDVIRLLGTISKLRQKNLVGSKDTRDKVLALQILSSIFRCSCDFFFILLFPNKYLLKRQAHLVTSQAAKLTCLLGSVSVVLAVATSMQSRQTAPEVNRCPGHQRAQLLLKACFPLLLQPEDKKCQLDKHSQGCTFLFRNLSREQTHFKERAFNLFPTRQG